MGKYLQHLEKLVPDEEDIEDSDAWTCVLHRGDLPDEAADDHPFAEQRTVVVDDPALLSLRDEPPVPDHAELLDETRGWGPANAPEELQRTTSWERRNDGGLVLVREAPDVDESEFEDEPPTIAIQLSDVPPEPANVTQRVRQRGGWMRRSRITMIAALCGVGGSVLGVAIGLYVKGESTETTGTLPAMVAVAPEPAPAAPAGIVAPSSPPAMAPAAVAPPEPEGLVAQAGAAAPEAGAAAPEAVTAEAVAAEPVVVPAEPAPDPVQMTREALDEGDLNRAASELERARLQATPAFELAGLDARLAVLRGEGAPAVPRLRAHAQQHGEPTLWVALGRVLVQAERDEEAAEAFEAATALDPDAVEALVGLALIEARHAEIPAAQRYLRAAQEAARAMPQPDHILMARLSAAEGAVELERGRLTRATEEARRAQLLDPRSSEASLLLARIALLRRQDATDDLRAAVDGRAPAPISMGLLAPRVRGQEACELATRYLERAPEGFDSRAMQRIARRCNSARSRLHP